MSVASKAVLNIILRATGETDIARVRKSVAELNKELEKSDPSKGGKGGGGFFKQLKGITGEESALGELAKMAKGAGAVAGVVALADGVNRATKAIADFRDGAASLGDVLKGIPIFGTGYEIAENLDRIFRPERWKAFKDAMADMDNSAAVGRKSAEIEERQRATLKTIRESVAGHRDRAAARAAFAKADPDLPEFDPDGGGPTATARLNAARARAWSKFRERDELLGKALFAGMQGDTALYDELMAMAKTVDETAAAMLSAANEEFRKTQGSTVRRLMAGLPNRGQFLDGLKRLGRTATEAAGSAIVALGDAVGRESIASGTGSKGFRNVNVAARPETPGEIVQRVASGGDQGRLTTGLFAKALEGEMFKPLLAQGVKAQATREKMAADLSRIADSLDVSGIDFNRL